jgi:hypothetical protein
VVFLRCIAAFLGGARAKRTHPQGQRKRPKGERRNDLQEAPPAWPLCGQNEKPPGLGLPDAAASGWPGVV